mgnify:CR=1 FL=1
MWVDRESSLFFDWAMKRSRHPERAAHSRRGKAVRKDWAIVAPVVAKEIIKRAGTQNVLAEETFEAFTNFENSRTNILKFDIVGQKNHGVCAVGANPWDAYEHIERLEHICEIVLSSGIKPPGLVTYAGSSLDMV